MNIIFKNGWNKRFWMKTSDFFKYFNGWNVYEPSEQGGIDQWVTISSVTSIKEKICSPKHGLILSPDVVVRNMQRFWWLECFNLDLPWRSKIELHFPGRCFKQHHLLLYSTPVHELRTQDTGKNFVLSLTWSPTSFPQPRLSMGKRCTCQVLVKIPPIESIQLSPNW